MYAKSPKIELVWNKLSSTIASFQLIYFTNSNNSFAKYNITHHSVKTNLWFSPTLPKVKANNSVTWQWFVWCHIWDTLPLPIPIIAYDVYVSLSTIFCSNWISISTFITWVRIASVVVAQDNSTFLHFMGNFNPNHIIFCAP